VDFPARRDVASIRDGDPCSPKSRLNCSAGPHVLSPEQTHAARATAAPTLGHHTATRPGDALTRVLAHVAKPWLTFHIHRMGGGIPSGTEVEDDLARSGGTMRHRGGRGTPERRLPAGGARA